RHAVERRRTPSSSAPWSLARAADDPENLRAWRQLSDPELRHPTRLARRGHRVDGFEHNGAAAALMRGQPQNALVAIRVHRRTVCRRTKHATGHFRKQLDAWRGGIGQHAAT